MSTQTESDIILNRANVALARSQRLVASWLPAKSPEDQNESAKSEEDLQKEEDEIFTPVPETLGLGAPLPKNTPDGSWNRTELSSNEMLKKQLLGKNYKKVGKEPAVSGAERAEGPNSASGGTGSVLKKPADDEEEEEEEGRASLVGKKGKKPSGHPETIQPGLDNVGDENEEEPPTKKAAGSTARGKKKATSFLDEVLAERSKKRKKR